MFRFLQKKVFYIYLFLSRYFVVDFLKINNKGFGYLLGRILSARLMNIYVYTHSFLYNKSSVYSVGANGCNATLGHNMFFYITNCLSDINFPFSIFNFTFN